MTKAAQMTAYAENLKIGCFAGSGIGKTVGIGSLIKAYGAENVGVISCEHGLTSIASLLDSDHIKVCDSLDDLRAAHRWAAERYGSPHQWVCVDGGSRVLQWIEQEVWGGVEAAYAESLSGSVGSSNQQWMPFITKKDGINTQRVWSKVGSNAERLFNAFVKLPGSSYWTFWEQLTNIDQYTKGPPMIIDSPGEGTRKAAKGTFDFIYRLTRVQGKLVAKFRNDAVSYAKLREDWNANIHVPDEIVEFDLADFCERVRGKGWPQSGK